MLSRDVVPIPAPILARRRCSNHAPIDRPRALMENARIIIQGITTNGRAFRPSDWAERLCGIMSTFARDQQMRYSPFVRPMMLDGVRCVIVDAALADVEPRAYRFMLDFAKDNELIIVDPNAPLDGDVCPIPDSAMTRLTRSA